MNTLFLIIYVAGLPLVGLPMSLVSLWVYGMNELDLERNRFKQWIKLLRNFLYPFSFLISCFDDGRDKENYQSNYQGPISDLVDECLITYKYLQRFYGQGGYYGA